MSKHRLKCPRKYLLIAVIWLLSRTKGVNCMGHTRFLRTRTPIASKAQTMQSQAFLFKSNAKQCETKTVLSFFIALCETIWKRKPLSLCTYSRNVKSKDKKLKKNAEQDGPKGWAKWGECFIFLQQNSLIFFYVETETRELCKKARKMLKAKRQNTVCAFFETLLLVGR